MADLRPSINTGLPTGVKDRQRVDFNKDSFDRLIHQKGYQFYWSKAAICPCQNNDQTRQPDPVCNLCKGRGWIYFLPELGLENYSTDAHGNPIVLNEAKDAVLVTFHMTQASKDPQAYERMGAFVFGTVKLTGYSSNRLSYRDRLMAVDSIMCWSQLVTVKQDAQGLITVNQGRDFYGLRYPIINVHMIRSTDKIFQEGTDYWVNDSGELEWQTTELTAEQQLSITYDIHPVYIVLDHVYAFRDTMVAKKNKAVTRADQHTKMPIHAMARLDFLYE